MRRMYTVIVLLALWSGSSLAQPPVNLGTASNFAVLAGSTVTNTGFSLVNGDLGLSPGSDVSGFPPGIVNGTQHVADGVALQAQNDLTTAYNDAAGRTPDTTVTELGGTTVTPGVYNSASGTFEITGILTLDAQGDPNGVFIFQMATTLVTALSSQVVLIGGAQACNVFWQVGSSATLGTNSAFLGNILALSSITLTMGVLMDGRALARDGAVTLDTDTITVPIPLATAIDEAVPLDYSLNAYPNPFNPVTTVRFSLKKAGEVTLSVYNVSGQWMRDLARRHYEAGDYTVRFDAGDLPSGIYFARLDAGAFTQTRKMMLIK